MLSVNSISLAFVNIQKTDSTAITVIRRLLEICLVQWGYAEFYIHVNFCSAQSFIIHTIDVNSLDYSRKKIMYMNFSCKYEQRIDILTALNFMYDKTVSPP